MHVTLVKFENEVVSLSGEAPRALVLLCTATDRTYLLCTSPHPATSDISEHRAAWLIDAVRQIERMPEFRTKGQKVDISNAVLEAAGIPS